MRLSRFSNSDKAIRGIACQTVIVRLVRRPLRFTLAAASLIAAVGALAHCGSHPSDCLNAPCSKGSGYDFIVVGSGAGGGPLAARLARAGKRVLLLEAGTDVGDAKHYRVPAMHALSTEDPALAWWYFVQHHADPAVEASDSKITKDGVLYPRGSALGGSTAVNAMVTVLPSPADWDRLADLTGDGTFRASSMTKYEARVREWLSVELPDPALALGDPKVSGFLQAATQSFASQESTNASGPTPPGTLAGAGSLASLLGHDVNDALRVGEARGVFRLPLATSSGTRNGPRELLLKTVADGYPLTIQTGAFVTRVLFRDGADVPTAVGVEVIHREHVYSASLSPQDGDDDRQQVFTAGGEVILAAGTFNSPQLLELSGIGNRANLETLGVTVNLDKPAVGENLQDRYEASIVHDFDSPLDILSACTLGQTDASGADLPDPCFDAWNRGQGVYQTPGFLATVLRRSSASDALSDMQVFAVPSDARGYYPGYSADSAKAKTRFSWLLLKAHTRNHDGTVHIAEANPLSRPRIDFRYFDEANPLADPDLMAMVDGVKFVRDIAKRARPLVSPSTFDEIWPGASVASDSDIARFVRKETWGHHACCTDRMGKSDDPTSVVDPQFRVIGAKNLRVVDASVFPEIPGTFIALPTYMLAEKAADTILNGGEK